MDREGPYLPIDTKINFIEGSVWKIYGGGCNNPPLVRRVTKNGLVRQGLNVDSTHLHKAIHVGSFFSSTKVTLMKD